MNHVLLRGDVRVAPVLREVDGKAAVSFDVMTELASGKRTAVPVLWLVSDVPDWLDAGVNVAVRGEVFRRFFVAGGARQSLVDVSAAEVVKATPARLRRIVENYAMLCVGP